MEHRNIQVIVSGIIYAATLFEGEQINMREEIFGAKRQTPLTHAQCQKNASLNNSFLVANEFSINSQKFGVSPTIICIVKNESDGEERLEDLMYRSLDLMDVARSFFQDAKRADAILQTAMEEAMRKSMLDKPRIPIL